MEDVEKVESTNEEVEETQEEESSNEVEPKVETEGSYSKSDIDSKFILFEDRIRAYINEVLASKNETNNENENDEQQKERNWD